MFGPFLRVVAVLALVAVLAGIGIGIYNAGVNEGLTQAAIAAQAAGEDPAVVVPPYAGPYGYGWGHWGGGFGFFGFLFAIFAIFLLFGLLRAAFGWGRWNGGGRGGPGGWGGGREERIAEYHRELHKRDVEPSAG
jgi:hypothetical protein